MIKNIAFASALFVLTGTAQAADGLLIVQKTTSGGAPQTHQIQIENKRMRAESSSATGGKTVVMFDAAKEVLTMVDMDKKTYSELTKADVEAMGAQMAQLAPMMAQMQEQMKNMPPEQRAQFEAMMKGRMGGAGMPGAAAPKTQYRKAGTAMVGKWTCDKYEGFEGEQKTSEVCTVDPKALGFAATDFEVTKQLRAFMKKMMPQMAGQMFSIGTQEEQGFSGVPVRQTITVGGRQVTSEISEVSRQSFADSVFQVPAGFQKTDPMGGRGRGR
jgi:Domain of unknown function (DUF4412)